MADTSPTDSSTDVAWTSPGAGITAGYDGNSETLRIFIILFTGLAVYNALELFFVIFMTFTRHRGLYFWCVLAANMGIVPYALGFQLKFMNWTVGDLRWIAVVFLSVGWYPMVTGQSLVLWSRLHLIVSGERGDRIIWWTKWMIIVNAVILHIPTTVLTVGANSDTLTETFVYGYNIMEKIQMCGFFCQEVILSSIYIVETAKILRSSLQPGTRKTMHQLIFINAIIILMDLGLLGIEAASLYILETLLKGIIYSIKLKLEFAILGKLVKFVGGSRTQESVLADPRKSSIGFVGLGHSGQDRKSSRDCSQGGDGGRGMDMNVNDFVDLSRVRTDVTHPTRASTSLPERRKQVRGVSGADQDFDFARFEHIEDVTSLGDEASGSSRRSSWRDSVFNGGV